jgi:hypothetical protein
MCYDNIDNQRDDEHLDKGGDLSGGSKYLKPHALVTGDFSPVTSWGESVFFLRHG